MCFSVSEFFKERFWGQYFRKFLNTASLKILCLQGFFEMFLNVLHILISHSTLFATLGSCDDGHLTSDSGHHSELSFSELLLFLFFKFFEILFLLLSLVNFVSGESKNKQDKEESKCPVGFCSSDLTRRFDLEAVIQPKISKYGKYRGSSKHTHIINLLHILTNSVYRKGTNDQEIESS